jgi:hypothetical protein
VITIEYAIIIPLMDPSLLEYEINLLAHSATNKKKGDNKYVGMIPLEALKKLEGEPFIRTSKEVEDK